MILQQLCSIPVSNGLGAIMGLLIGEELQQHVLPDLPAVFQGLRLIQSVELQASETKLWMVCFALQFFKSRAQKKDLQRSEPIQTRGKFP